VLDLANSICRQMAGAGPVDLGHLVAMAVSLNSVAVSLGEVDYSDFAYDNNAQITELPLTPEQVQMLQQGTLKLTMSRTDIGIRDVLTEPANTNIQFCAEQRVVRMNGDPYTTAAVRVYVSKRGVPWPGKKLEVFLESVYGTTPGATVAPTNPGNSPKAHKAVKATISASDSDGYATVTLTVLKDPGQRTPELDGQLYFIVVYDPDLPHPDWSKKTSPAPPQDQTISCLVFSQYPVNQNPQWAEIKAMFVPYMKLYPSMRERLDLTDPTTFEVFAKNPPWSHGYNVNRTGPLGIVAGAIPYYLSLDFNDPRYMPISRDLSPAKVSTIMHFIKNLQAQPGQADTQKQPT